MVLCRIFRKNIFALLILFLALAPWAQAQNNSRKYNRYNNRKDLSYRSGPKKSSSLSSGDLLYLLRNGENHFFKLTEKNLYQNNFWRYGRLFSWTSARKEAARYYSGKGRKSVITFANKKFAEAILYFEKGKFSRLYVSLFNEGDETGMTYTRNSFNRFLEQLENNITLLTGHKPTVGKQKIKRHESIHFYSWQLPEYTLKVIWSGGKNRQGGAIYCYAELSGANSDSMQDHSYAERAGNEKTKGKSPIKASKVKKGELIKNVVKKDNKVYIPNIPMVDQGPKGYCVPAVLERVMGYYGVILNQHILASLMKSSASGGTSLNNMYLALKQTSKKLNINVRRQYEYFRSVSDLEKFVSKYNSIAKKEKGEKIRIEKFGERIDLEKTFLAVNPEIGRKAVLQLKKRGFEKSFCGFIKEKIDAGIPVIWAVNLALSPEKNVGRNGHLRLITGYGTEERLAAKDPRQNRGRKNSSGKTSSSGEISCIIFSDTWGRGHEAKIMDASDAWAITTGLYLTEPDN